MDNVRSSDTPAGTDITFSKAVGVYPFSVTSNSGLTASPVSEGNVTVTADTNVEITWGDVSKAFYVDLEETGLRTGDAWSVACDSVELSSTVKPQPMNFQTFTFFNSDIHHFSASSSGYAAMPAEQDIEAGTGPTNTYTTYTVFVPNSNPYKAAAWNSLDNSYNVTNPGTVWSLGGMCFGMSSAAILYFMNYNLGENSYPYLPCQDPVPSSTFDLNLGDNSALNNASLEVMLQQCYGQPSALVPPASAVNMNEEYSNLVSSLATGIPMRLSLGNATGYYHVVVAWGCGTLENRSYVIVFYDPNFPESTRFAIYDPLSGYFAYTAGSFQADRFAVSNPAIIDMSWDFNGKPTLSTQWQWPLQRWKEFSIYNNYDIVIANKNVTVEVNGLEDTFSAMGNSQAFVKNISGSSGIEEGNTQAYAIQWLGKTPTVHDPDSNQSLIFISHVSNGSGQTVEYDYTLNASTTEGDLNYTVTPTETGLLLATGDNGFNATVFCHISNGQGDAVSDMLTTQLGAEQNVTLTAPCIASFVPTKRVVGQGYPVPMNVTINNAGPNPENVTLTLSANGTSLNDTSVFNLLNGTSVNLVCGGNTSSLAYGNYTLSAYCTPNGVNEAANNFTCTGIVTVTIPGDINGDFKVSLVDLVYLANAYGTTPASGGILGAAHAWNPNADTDGNGVVGLTDLVILALHYGQHYP